MKKALILGASGQVGQALIKELESRGWAWEGSYHRHAMPGQPLFALDLSDLEALRRAVTSRSPTAVFLPSGFTWVDGCEDDPKLAFRVNAQAAEAAAKAASGFLAPLVFYSTDYVFGLEGGPYDEMRSPKPLGVYGASKLAGEEKVLDAWPGSLVLRTNVVYGPEPQGKNFIYQLRKNLSEGKPMRLPQDQISSPTYNRDLARASVELVERKETGIWNVAGPELIDRYAFGLLAARVFGLDSSLLEPVATASLRQKAPRPLGAGLVIDKLAGALGWVPRAPAQGLEDMKSEIEKSQGGRA